MIPLTPDEADMLRRLLTYWLDHIDICEDESSQELIDELPLWMIEGGDCLGTSLKLGGPEHLRSRELLRSVLGKLAGGAA